MTFIYEDLFSGGFGLSGDLDNECTRRFVLSLLLTSILLASNYDSFGVCSRTLVLFTSSSNIEITCNCVSSGFPISLETVSSLCFLLFSMGFSFFLSRLLSYLRNVLSSSSRTLLFTCLLAFLSSGNNLAGVSFCTD